MAKYRITENHLQRIFENLLINEYGSQHPDDPSNIEEPTAPQMSEPTRVEGEFTLVAFDGLEFLLRFNESPELFYTLGDSWPDIYQAMEPYLPIAQEKDADGEDDYQYGSPDWVDHVTDVDMANAVVSYMNNQYANGQLKYTTDLRTWDSNPGGEYEFLLISPEMAGDLSSAILSDKLQGIAQQFFTSSGNQ